LNRKRLEGSNVISVLKQNIQVSYAEMGSKHNLHMKEIVYFPSYQAECKIQTRLEISYEIRVLILLTLPKSEEYTLQTETNETMI